MGWVKLDDGFADHPKIAAAGPTAAAADVAGMCYAARHLSDGFVPRSVASSIASAKVLDKLVEVGRWEKDSEGFWIHDYLEYNPSGAEERSRRDSDRKRKGSEPESGKSPGGEKPSRTRTPNSQHPRDVVRLCDLLAELIEANGSKRPPVTTAWLTSCRLMLEADQRPLAEVEELLRWCQSDDFWRGNVLSMPTFRRQYDRLRLQMHRPPTRNGNSPDAVNKTLAQADELRRRGL